MVIALFPVSYIGLLYFSATSAKVRISNIGFHEIPDPLEALLSRQIDIDVYFDIEGRGMVSIPVKSLQGQVYIENVYAGSVKAIEPFMIPASGTSTAHLIFHLDLKSISQEDIQDITSSISSHSGEVKIRFDGYVELIVLFFTVTIPVSRNVYVLTVSDAPKVSSMGWDSTSAYVGEPVGFHVTVENTFRGSPINGVLDLIVVEDVKLAPDVNAKVYHFPIQLSPGESKTLSDIFVPYKNPSTRGFFLKVQWGTNTLAEQDNNYPPRLRILERTLEGTLNLVDVYWTVNDEVVTSCVIGEEVKAHVVVKAVNGPVSGTITIKIRKDIAYAPDTNFKVKSFDVFLGRDESKEYIVTFKPDEASTGNLRGYFVEIEGDLSWTMESSYPPRLKVNEKETTGGIPSLQDVWWTVNDEVVTEAKQGQTVKAHIKIKAEGGNVEGTVTIRIRKDIALLPDEDYKVQSFHISLSKDQVIELTVTFTASEKSGLTFRGYFIQIDFNSWGTTWTMRNSYPPRLKVN